MAEDSDPVSFDVDAVLEAARTAVDDDSLLLCVAYDDRDFRTVYVDERVAALYEDEAAMEAHFGRVHSYVNLDFTERELFEELFVDPDGIRAFVTYMGNLSVVRVLRDEEGVFLGLAPGTEVTGLVDAVEDALRA